MKQATELYVCDENAMDIHIIRLRVQSSHSQIDRLYLLTYCIYKCVGTFCDRQHSTDAVRRHVQNTDQLAKWQQTSQQIFKMNGLVAHCSHLRVTTFFSVAIRTVILLFNK